MVLFLSSKKPVTVVDHVCEMRGVAADFAGTILTLRAQCVQHTTEARVMQESPRSKQRDVSVPRGHPPLGCSGVRMLSKHERYYGLGMDALVSERARTRTLLLFGHACTGKWTLSNTNAIMVWAWMLW